MIFSGENNNENANKLSRKLVNRPSLPNSNTANDDQDNFNEVNESNDDDDEFEEQIN